MIVKRTWISTKTRSSFDKNLFKIDGETYRHRTKKWEGWFLLGFIPVYIKQISVSYK